MTNDKLWRYPLPNNIGLEIDPKDGLKISRVIKGSPAETSGLKAGQSIAYMNDQLILSIADIQWVLHHLPNTTTQIRIRPWNSGRNHILTTRVGWKKSDISWRGSLWNLHPRLRVYMPAAKPNELKKLKLPAGQHALKVQWINNASAEGQAALKAGLKLNDFIIAMAGKPFGKAIDHDNFNAQVKLNYKSGQKLPLTLMRNGKRIEFQWPLQ
jgi:C-terminal processing protease CtpA/Prc